MSTAAVSVAGREKRHPRGLSVLFVTEMWERFSYYGMRAILVYYMTKQLMFSQERSSHIYGLYTGFVYFTPFFGGILADRWLGQRRTVFLGGALMTVAQFMLMSQDLFFAGLVLLIIGNGCFKPNISTQVGALYSVGDHRRDRAYSIFYLGINLGSLIGPLICGMLGERVAWRWGFCAAGVGMFLGLILYAWGQRHLAPDNVMRTKAGEVSHESLTREEKIRIMGFVVLCIFNIFFWAIYEQQGNTTALWADANTNRHIFGWQMPASWVQAFNPICIFLFTPLILWLWKWQARRGKEPASVTKMAIGCFLLGISYLVFIPAARINAGGTLTSLWWIIGNTALLTMGELYLSPVGLSLVTKLAPARMVSMLMGVWFLSNFFGNYLCGYLGTFWEKMPKEQSFLMFSAIAMAAGFGMLIILKPLKRAIGHGHEEQVDV
ncbi:MAG: peptide MFS transporter [bacterium]